MNAFQFYVGPSLNLLEIIFYLNKDVSLYCESVIGFRYKTAGSIHKGKAFDLCVPIFKAMNPRELRKILDREEWFFTLDDRSFSHLLKHHPLTQLFLQSLDIYFNCQHTPF